MEDIGGRVCEGRGELIRVYRWRRARRLRHGERGHWRRRRYGRAWVPRGWRLVGVCMHAARGRPRVFRSRVTICAFLQESSTDWQENKRFGGNFVRIPAAWNVRVQTAAIAEKVKMNRGEREFDIEDMGRIDRGAPDHAYYEPFKSRGQLEHNYMHIGLRRTAKPVICVQKDKVSAEVSRGFLTHFLYCVIA